MTTPSPISDQAAGEPTVGIPAAFVQWFECAWAAYLDKAFTDKVTSMAWALKMWRHCSTAPTTGSAPDIDGIMEQAQVFASAWSLVGGPFDGGDMMETALAEKENLRAILAASMGGEKA